MRSFTVTITEAQWMYLMHLVKTKREKAYDDFNLEEAMALSELIFNLQKRDRSGKEVTTRDEND